MDWLLADMLISPGVCLGLLRKWLGNGWARRFIVNVKLPQRNPLPALQPLRDYFAKERGLRVSLRQLYHDRREITVMGERTPPGKPARPAPGAAASRRGGGKPARRKKSGR